MSVTDPVLPSPVLAGGNQIRQFGADNPGGIYARSPYYYGGFLIEDGETVVLPDFIECVLFVRHADDGAQVRLKGGKICIGALMSAELENFSGGTLAAEGGSAFVLVAGLEGASDGEEACSVTEAGAHYRVDKPWGHELWINGDHPKYVLKEIAIKAGTKTSLQYHNFKEETNVLFDGQTDLVFKANPDVANDDVTAADLGDMRLDPVSSIHVTPQILHRLIAVTDVLLYEVSTPYLDDVIRVSDDTARADGRIQAEHGSSQ